jgi:hypothetical protein
MVSRLGLGEGSLWYVRRYCPNILMERLEKTSKSLSRYSQLLTLWTQLKSSAVETETACHFGAILIKVL